MLPIAGVDGCKNGWLVVTEERAFVSPDFEDLLTRLPDETIAVDIPIGLHEEYVERGRVVDQLARSRLGPKGRSVFSAPPRRAFGATTLPQAQARGCRITQQTLNILDKVQEVDDLLSPELQMRVREVHPELSFLTLNNGQAVTSRKICAAGRAERRALLGPSSVPDRPRQGEKEDDLLDACAALWTARRIASGHADVIAGPHPDPRGLRMEMWL